MKHPRMGWRFFLGVLALSWSGLGWTGKEAPTAPEKAEATTGPVEVYLVPVHGQISEPQLFILRRALKQAIEEEVGVVVLDMDTPGGSAATMLSMMEALDNFNGETIAFVGEEAISAGAYIASATDRIFMAEDALIGASEVVQGTGEDVAEGMKRKIESYLAARVRALNDEHPYRGQVLRAMSEANYVFEVDGKVLKKEGELLTLTGREAHASYGNPAQPLLAEGLYPDVQAMLAGVYGPDRAVVKEYELTWSEEFAKYMAEITPILLGIGFLLLFIEFKTPGFGVMGIAGIALILVVFASTYVAGLAGYEPVLLFLVGAALILLEFFLLPGTVLLAATGILVMLVALVWTLADVWPAGANTTLSADMFVWPVINVFSGIFLGLGGLVALARMLPRGWVWDRIVLQTAVAIPGDNVAVGREGVRPEGSTPAGPGAEGKALPAPGTRGVAVTDLFPSGEIEAEGRRYQARTQLRQIDKGTRVVVVDRKDFALIVKPE